MRHEAVWGAEKRGRLRPVEGRAGSEVGTGKFRKYGSTQHKVSGERPRDEPGEEGGMPIREGLGCQGAEGLIQLGKGSP